MIRLRDVKRFNQRGTGAIAIIIGFILLTVTAALVITTMISMNSTRSEDLAQRARQAAYSGLNQFLLDVEQGILSAGPGSGLTLEANFLKDYSVYHSPDPFASATAALAGVPASAYPLPNAQPFLLQSGNCYITFQPGNTAEGISIPFSTDNLMNTVDTTGWNHRVVPAHSVDIIATGIVNGMARSVAVRVTQQWAYALTAAHQIYLSGGRSNAAPGTLPAQVFGNVLDMASGSGTNPAVTIGADPSNAYCQNCLVSGTVSLTGSDPTSLRVYAANPLPALHTGARVLRYPTIQTPDTTGMTDLQSVVAGMGFSLTNEPGTDIWDLDCTTAGAVLNLSSGSFFLNGSLKIAATSNCGGIALNQAMLRIVDDHGVGDPTTPPGSLVITDKSCRLLGVSSALVVDGDLDFWYGFFDSATDNFVVAAHDLDCMAGGILKGVVIVDNLMVMRSAPVDPSNFYIGGRPVPGAAVPVALSTQSPGCYCATVTPTASCYFSPSPTSTATPTGVNTPPPPGPTGAPPPQAQVAAVAASVGQAPDPNSGLYKLEIDGAVVARNISSQVDSASAPYLVLGGVQVKYDAQYLQVLNVDAPLFISSMEMVNL